jgi:hypothetical protein
MHRITGCFACLTFAVLAVVWCGEASSQGSRGSYQPVVPSPSMNTYGGYGWSGGYGTTAAGSAMQGMASVISAQGNYNLATSAAAVNMTQAQRNHIQNRQMWTNTYFEMRAANRAAVAAERRPPPTMEQLARLASEGAPKPLPSSQLDPVTGKVAWPELLQDDRYAPQRGQLEELVGRHSQYGALGLSEQAQARKIVDSMFQDLRARIREVPPQSYSAARSFLQSLLFTLTGSTL